MSIHISGVSEAIQHIEGYRKRIDRNQHILLEKLAGIGIETAKVRFSTAQYDGVNDVVVPSEPTWVSKDKLFLSANGSTVAFIEFGTGVHYSETHPKAGEFGAVRGGYGYGLGRLDSWRYKGEPGTNGESSEKHPGEIVTHGNPPAMAMFNAAEDIRKNILDIAKEVYKNG